MAEHYTRNTLEVTRWCNRCARFTQHAVSGGRVGQCKEHEAPKWTHAQLVRMAKEKKRRRLAEEARVQPSLFAVGGEQ